jgi:hypothetical protein
MKRFWGVVIGFSLGCALYADDTVSATRTPHGLLWAGTTFTLQATATAANNLVVTSTVASVRVGQVYRWEMSALPPAGMSVSSGSALFRFQLTNMGNGFDRVQFIGWQDELTPEQVWQVALFEDSNGNGAADGSEAVSAQGSLLAPVQSLTYLLRAQPPASTVPTDGVWMGVAARSASGQGPLLPAEYVAGAIRSLSAHSRGFSYAGYYMYASPVLYDGRVFWMGTDSNNTTRIFYTPTRIDQSGGTLNSNRSLYGRVLNFVPNGFSVLVENGWFVGTTDGRLLRLDMTRILANDTSSDPFVSVTLPSGVQPRLDLQPIVYRSRLYLVGNDNRLHVLSASGSWLTQSARPSSGVGTISCPPLLTSRAIVAGTSNGYVIMFDLITGGIRLARQVGNTAVKSLAITRDERYLLVQLGDTRVMAITTSQGTTYWMVNLLDAIVSPLAYDPTTDAVLLLTRSGWLHAFYGATGTPCPHYPQQIFSGEPIERAVIATLRRNDRKSPYAYVLAQQRISGNSATQGRLSMVTVLNPYNRYEVSESQMNPQSDYLPAIAFTGDTPDSLCLIFQRQAYAGTNTQGVISAFRVQ